MNDRFRAAAPMLALAALGGCGGGYREPAPQLEAARGPLPDGGYAPAAPEQFGRPDAAPGADYGAPDLYPQQAPPADLPRMPPPREDRYDNVGYAAWSLQPGSVAAAHRTLPPGSFAEVTSLDTGRTVLVPVTARSGSSREIELSGAAAELLGLQGRSAGVRVRRVTATPADQAALRLGRPAPARPDTPPVLLNALRRKLAGGAGEAVASPETARPAPPVAQRPQPPQRGGPGFYVQLVALSDGARARATAQGVGGSVQPAGGLYRVRLGPFRDLAAAQRARDDSARRGYGDARIVRED